MNYLLTGRDENEVKGDKKGGYEKDDPHYWKEHIPGAVLAQPEQNVDVFILPPRGEK